MKTVTSWLSSSAADPKTVAIRPNKARLSAKSKDLDLTLRAKNN